LFSALASGDKDKALSIIEATDPKELGGKDPDGCSAMCRAISNRMPVAALALARKSRGLTPKQGNRCDDMDADGAPALWLAAASGRETLCLELLAAGARMRVNSILCLAIERKMERLSRALIAASKGKTPREGSCLEDADDDGATPLMVATRIGRMDIADALADAGARVDNVPGYAETKARASLEKAAGNASTARFSLAALVGIGKPRDKSDKRG
jgi:ankyrin repeat protein